MRVGVPKEIKNREYRVGLTPDSVREFVSHGHEVVVETAAGHGVDDAVAALAASQPQQGERIRCAVAHLQGNER